MGVTSVSLTEEMKSSFLSYSLAIFNRSLPDCIDGLKLAQRRVILGLRDLNLKPEGAYKKVSRLEGHVLGSYHPQGGCASTAVNMGQADAFRYPLTDIHGNVGGSIQTGPAMGQSISEDPPAAARYLEVKGTSLVEQMFVSQISPHYGEWRENYDGSTRELVRIVPPLPALLINGSQGIASGYACYHIPYNITDVVNGTIAYIKNKSILPSSLRAKFTGPPDFAQGGRVVKDQGLIDAMDKGQGAVKVYGTWEVIKDVAYGKKAKRDMVIITSLPYSSSEKFLEKVHSLVEAEKLQGVVDASDHSSRDGIRVQLVLKPGADVDHVISALISGTNLCHIHNVNATAVVNNVPVVLGVKNIIEEWYKMRCTYLKSRYAHEVSVINTQIERFSGVVKVLGDVDKLVMVLKKSKTRDSASSAIQKTWKLTPLQAKEVLDTPLSRLVATEVDQLREKIASLESEKAKLEGILSDNNLLDQEIIAQVTSFKAFSGSRRAKFDQVDVKTVVREKTLSLKEQILKEAKEMGMGRREIQEFFKNREKHGKWEGYKEKWLLDKQLSTREGRKERKLYLSDLKAKAEQCGMSKRGAKGWSSFIKGREDDSLPSIRKAILEWEGVDKKRLGKLV
jgi:DNA gyrase subunit A